MPVDWHELARVDAIARLGAILRRQLNVWVDFLGPSGQVAPIGPTQRVDKPLCDAFIGRYDVNGSCLSSLRTWFEAFRDGDLPCDGPQLLSCHGHLEALAIPVSLDDEVVGVCFASGFVRETSAEEASRAIFQRGKALDLGRTPVAQGLRDVPLLTERELLLLGDMLQAIVDTALTALGHDVRVRGTRVRTGGRDYGAITGKSAAMLRLFQLLDKVCESDSTVLLQGEGGVGKELVARAVHNNSLRNDLPFVVQNCSALNDSLLDSELFGHRRGSFTGAISDKQGLFALADRGTFFLDEIGDMSPMLQVKLLRVLQEGTFLPVGDTVVRKVDVRIIAATNRDLQSMVKEKSFRSDLYYRLNVINVRVPPLRDRVEDIPLLVERFLETKSAANHLPRRIISMAALERLLAYQWPGNVRELENEIERLVVLSGDDEEIPVELVSPRISGMQREHRAPSTATPPKLGDNLPEALEFLERHMILESLERTRWNKTRTAKELGISRRNLIRKVDRYGLDDLRHGQE